MHSQFVRAISRVVIVCLSAVSLHAHAGLIGSGETVAAAQAQAAQSYGTRAALANRLEALGIAPENARDRLAALTDAEVAQLAGQLDSLPAGGSVPGITVGVVLVIIFLFWRFQFSDQAKAEAKTTKEPAKEPAKKQ